MMAERVGFEPTRELPPYSISSAAPSASSDTAPCEGGQPVPYPALRAKS